jgi:hypothetical protein
MTGTIGAGHEGLHSFDLRSAHLSESLHTLLGTNIFVLRLFGSRKNRRTFSQ